MFDTRDDAERNRDAVLLDIADGNAVPADAATIEKVGPQFLKLRALKIDDKATDKSRWKHIASSKLARLHPSQVTQKKVQSFVDSLERKRRNWIYGTERNAHRISRQTIKHVVNLLRSFFKWCMREEQAALKVEANPVFDIELPDVVSPPSDDVTYLELTEQLALHKAADTHLRWIVAFAFGVGLRQGEQWNLELRDVHVNGTAAPRATHLGSLRLEWEAAEEPKDPPRADLRHRT